MARSKGNEGDARARLVEAAGRGFRTGGFGGAGVDALAKGAGLTSGAFYAHFDSKAEAFRLAVVDGLSFLRGGILTFQESHGRNWREPFIDFYLGARMRANARWRCSRSCRARRRWRAPSRTSACGATFSRPPMWWRRRSSRRGA